MKHLFTSLLLLLTVLLLPATANAYDFVVDGIFYNKLSACEVEVTFVDEAFSFYSNEVNIPSSFTFQGNTYSVISIGNSAFYNCKELTSIRIPSSVTTIGSDAFSGCNRLSNIIIPNSVTSIGDWAFAYCNKLTKIRIPNSVISIGNNALFYCSGLKDVYSYITDISNIKMGSSVFKLSSQDYAERTLHVPYGTLAAYQADSKWSRYFGSLVEMDPQLISFTDSNVKALCVQNWDTNGDGDLSKGEAAAVTNIGTVFTSKTNITSFDELQYFTGLTSITANAFSNCSNLTRITIPNSVTSIGNKAFYGCSGLTSINIPNSVTTIGKETFYGCSGLTSINIPNSVTTISVRAFCKCSGLTYVSIPNSVTLIDEYTFSSCSRLTRIDIPNSVTFIGPNAFSGTAWYDNQPDGLIYAGLVAYKYKGTMPYGTNFSLREDTRGIAGYAFSGCSGLTSITIPNTITSIGQNAFYNCSGLTNIVVRTDNLHFDSRENCNAIIETASNTLIVGCKNSIIPNSVTSIGDYAFSGCSGLTNIDIPNSVTSIGSYAFSGCNGLTNIDIPNSVTSIGEGALYKCSALNNVYSFITAPSLISMGVMVFWLYPENYSARTLHVPYGTSAAYQADSKWSQYFGSIVEMDPQVISFADANVKALCVQNWDPDGDGELNDAEAAAVTSIGAVFKSKTNITSFDELQYFTGLTEIPAQAFGSCKNLTSITIPSNVTTIGSSAFSYCSGLTSIDIPNAVTSIGSSAFAYCSGLTSLSIGSAVTTIGQNAFISCSGLAAIKVAGGNTVYDSRDYCNALIETASNTLLLGCKNTVIPNTVTDIGYAAFRSSGLTSITIPNSVTYIGEWAFGNCTGLTAIDIPNSVQTIYNSAFNGCSGLTSVNIPSSVTSLCYCAFNGCTALTDVYSYITDISSIYTGSSVFNLSSQDYADRTLHVPYGTSAAYQAEPKWSQYFGSIVEMDAPVISFADANVKALCVQNWDTEGDGELNVVEAAAVTSIGTVFKSKTNITSFDELQYFTGLTEIPAQAFGSCKNLTSITIPSNVTTIGSSAFSYCSGLTSIDIPNAVTSIGSSAFAYCSGLTSLSIGSAVTTIGQNAFISCSGLAAIKVAGGNTVYDSRDYCNALIETASNTLLLGCKNTVIPNTVTDIGYAAFRSSGLTSITIPNSVTYIGEWAFGNCTGLTAIDIPNSVQTIYNSAFNGCSGLTSVNIPSSVTSLCYCAFNGCAALTDVYSYITDISSIYTGSSVFNLSSQDYADRTLHVPYGTSAAYQAEPKWSQFFGSIVEMDPVCAESIELDKTEAIVFSGETLQLTATVLPDNAYNKAVAWSSSDPSVAAVDDKGLVIGVNEGTATITAMTIDDSDLSATCIVTVNRDLSGYDNYLTMNNTTAFNGDTIVIPVAMTNAASIISFQTDIFLPEGLEIAQEDGGYLIEGSDRMTRTHGIMSNEVSNGAVRVICYSSNYKAFTGNSGDDLFYITVKVADNAVGDYTISLRNTLFTTSDFEEIPIPNVAANINVKTILLGDANGSGNVTVTDVVVTSKYVLEMNPSPFAFENADVNADGNITVTDVSRIAYLVMYSKLNAPRRMPVLTTCSDRMGSENVTLMPGETRTVGIMLNNKMDYSAFQIDMTLPDGITAGNFQLTDRAGDHAFDVNRLSNGKLRALCYSPSLEAIDGNSGTLLTFDVSATGIVDSDITVDDIELVTTDCQTVLLDSFTIGVNGVTNVNEMSGGKTVARVDYYNLAGQRIDRPDSGVTLVVTTYTDGTRTTAKLIR